MEFRVEKRFKNVLVSGGIATIIAFLIACIGWPIWALIVKTIISTLAGVGLAQVNAEAASQYIKDVTEGTFFWMSINSWVWITLIFGNYGKYAKSKKQPIAGLRYTIIAFFIGAGVMLAMIGFLGIWWKPFNLATMFMPKTAEQVLLATEGWAAANFYAVPVLICQIPIVSLFGKWPFAGKISPPWDGFGAMMTTTALAIIVWLAMVVPSFLKFQIEGEAAIISPMGSWPSVLAFCQIFIFLFLFPAIGGEQYPYKLFTEKQPWKGVIGISISLAGAFVIRGILRIVLTPLDLLNGQPVDLVVASLVLSIITTALLWHHQFFDFPGEDKVKNSGKRVLIRLAIVLVIGTIMGLVWMKAYKILPFGANNMGFGYSTLGIIAGQFVFMMPFLYMNTFFDKWPLIKQFEKDETRPKKVVQV